MSDHLRLGLIGAGVAAQAIHLPVLDRRSDLFTVTAVCDASATAREAAAGRCGLGRSGCHERVEELLGDRNVDAVLVLTSGSHGRICAEAAAAGLPVFCEKPLAYTLAEAEALTAASGTLALGYMKLYDSAFRLALELLEGVRPFRAIEVTVLHPSAAAQLRELTIVPGDDVPPAVQEAFEAETDELLERALGSAPDVVKRLYARELLSSVVHDLALVRALVSDPVRCTYAEAWPEADPSSLAMDCVLADDVRLSIRWHYLPAYPAYTEAVRVHHEAGSVQIVFPSPYLLEAPTVLQVIEQGGGGVRRKRYESKGSSFEAELVAFHGLVTAGTPTAAGIAEGRADIATCQQIARRIAETRGLPVGGEAAA